MCPSPRRPQERLNARRPPRAADQDGNAERLPASPPWRRLPPEGAESPALSCANGCVGPMDHVHGCHEASRSGDQGPPERGLLRAEGQAGASLPRPLLPEHNAEAKPGVAGGAGKRAHGPLQPRPPGPPAFPPGPQHSVPGRGQRVPRVLQMEALGGPSPTPPATLP